MMAVGGAVDGHAGPMVPDYGSQAVGVRRYHGRRIDMTLGTLLEHEEMVRAPNGKQQVVKVMKRPAAFVPSDEPVFEIPSNTPYIAEYLRHLRDGDLIPADEATAQFAWVQFDPTFARSLHRIHAEEKARAALAPRDRSLADVTETVRAALAQNIGRPIVEGVIAGFDAAFAGSSK
jgi:hypothetical protein